MKDRQPPDVYDPNEFKMTAWARFRRLKPYKPMLYAAKKRASELGLPFNLTDADISIPEVCPVLGLKLQSGSGRPCDSSPSLDRIIPAMGYVSGNVRVISYRANALKSNATLEELRAIVADSERIRCHVRSNPVL